MTRSVAAHKAWFRSKKACLNLFFVLCHNVLARASTRSHPAPHRDSSMSQQQAKPVPDTPQQKQQQAAAGTGLKRARSDGAVLSATQTKRRSGPTTATASTPDGTVGSRRKGRIMEVFPQEIFMLMHNTRAAFCLFAEIFKQLGQPLGCTCYAKIASLVHNGYGPYTKLVSILDMAKVEALAAEKQAQQQQQQQHPEQSDSLSDDDIGMHTPRSRIDVGYFAAQLRRATEQVVKQAGLQGRDATFGLSLIDFVPPGQHTRSTSFFLMYRLAAAASPACAASMMHSAEAADDDLAAMLLIAAASCARPSAAQPAPPAPTAAKPAAAAAATATTASPTAAATATAPAAGNATKSRSRELDSVFVPATASGRWIVCGVLDIVLSDDSTENLSYRSVREVQVCLEPQRIIAEFERYILRQDAPQRKTRTRSEAQRMRRRREHIAALRNARSSLESAKAAAAALGSASAAAETSSEDDTQALPTAATSPALSATADVASTASAGAGTGTVVASGESTPTSTALSPQSSSPGSPVGAFVVGSEALGKACRAGKPGKLPSLFELGLLPQSAATLVPSLGLA